MSSFEEKNTAATAAVVEPEAAKANGHGMVTREVLLGFAGKLKEEIVTIDEIGELLVGELTGLDRAEVLGKQAQRFREGEVDIATYQKNVLAKGILDPSSPTGSRTPMLRPGDGDQVMRLGAGAVTKIVDTIERLSGLGQHALVNAEGNSGSTQNAVSTS